jgi:predicted enzyme related to lactoylglutathione lyase
MGQPVVWFEVLGKDRDALVGFYGELFDWRSSPVEGWPYSMIDTGGEGGIGGGIADGHARRQHDRAVHRSRGSRDRLAPPGIGPLSSFCAAAVFSS